MNSAQSIIDQIVASKSALQQYGVTRIGVFGSAARGEVTPQSDIDLLVEFDHGKKTYRNFYGTATFMEAMLKRPVDLITQQSLSPYIKPHVMKDIRYVEIAG